MKCALEIAGDIWHAPAVIHRAIGAKLEESGWLVKKVYDTQVPFEALHRYDLIVLSRYALDDAQDNTLQKHLWITPEQETLLEQYVRGGGRILLHHDGISHYPKGGGLSTLARAFRVNHPPIGTITLTPVTDDANGLTQGVTAFSLADEEFNLELDESEVNVFLTSESAQHGRHLQGWYHTHGSGKVAVFIPGHDNTVLAHPMVRKLLENILRWLEA